MTGMYPAFLVLAALNANGNAHPVQPNRQLGKADRQKLVASLVERMRIGTQQELLVALQRVGCVVTQATVSRDIRELGLVKAAAEDGNYYYALVDDVSQAVRTTRVSVLKQMVRSVEASGNLIVVKGVPGAAPAIGEAIDHLRLTALIGTVAGDDTLLAVVREGASAKRIADKLMKEIGLK